MRPQSLLALALMATPLPLTAQSVAVMPHVGTLGLGVDAAIAVSDILGVRVGANFQPYTPEPEISDITYALNLPSPSIMATLDIHPGGSGFRFSGGFVYFSSSLELEGVLNEPAEIGNNEYTPSEVGTLTGTLVTEEFAPYIGIGLGKASGGTGFFFDAGVAFHGTPGVGLTADGTASSDPGFQADLALEASDLLDDVEGYTFYPVLAIGVSFAVR